MFDLNVNITGIEEVQRALQELEDALGSLHGPITSLEFDPGDPAEVAEAIKKAEAAIDGKLARFADNAFVQEIASNLKERVRQSILGATNEAPTGATVKDSI